VIGGGVKQVGQKRAPQGLFYRILHPQALPYHFYNKKKRSSEVQKMAIFSLLRDPPIWAHFEGLRTPLLGPKMGHFGPFWAILGHLSPL
jgi:hypothetical protein